MNFLRACSIVLAGLALACPGAASAGALGDNPALSGSGYGSRGPVSLLARPLVGFDLSRLQFSTSLSFGTGFGGRSEGLQVSRLSYQFGAPLAMSVSVGNAFGGGATRGGQNPFFLEGLDVAYRPNASMLFQVRYQNLRSPLQYGEHGFSGIDPSYLAR